MSEHPLAERARQAPEQPGVYQFQDARGRMLYVGKAKNLRRRVASYFARELEGKTAAMVAVARRLEFVVTTTEVEALILENRLIKQHRPRYNITLRDDKTFPYVKLTTGEEFPRAYLTRRVKDDGHSYFGPYLGKHLAARVMELIRTRTQVRTCRWEQARDGFLPRACLYYDLGACLGPCVPGLTSPEEYRRAVEEVTLLLAGRHGELRPRLEAQMARAAEDEEFERAARYRDLLRALEEVGRAQHVEVAGTGSVDVVGVHAEGEDASAVVLLYREGKLVDKREFHWEGLGQEFGPAQLASFLAQYYDANPAVPARVEVPFLPEDAATLEIFLRQRGGRRVTVRQPRRGLRARVMALARDNADAAFRLRFRQPRQEADRVASAIAERVGLALPVRRIECFDVSHSHGEGQVAALVVWEGGRLRKGEYRSFNVREGAGADDPAALAEAVRRRYRRRFQEGGALPDLVLVDGGRAQVAAAVQGLAELGLVIPVVGLAKRFEEVYRPATPEPLRLAPGDPVRLIFQQLRDEAHRFAVTRHRRRRTARRLATQLLALPGVGPVRAKKLLQVFGSVDGVRAAAQADIARVVGGATAAAVWAALHGQGEVGREG